MNHDGNTERKGTSMMSEMMIQLFINIAITVTVITLAMLSRDT